MFILDITIYRIIVVTVEICSVFKGMRIYAIYTKF